MLSMKDGEYNFSRSGINLPKEEFKIVTQFL